MKDLQLEKSGEGTHNFSFWFHLFITILAWLGPFLFSWYLMVLAYGIVILQFMVFNKCLLNAKHDLSDANDATFYSYLLEEIGVAVNRKKLKLFVRRYLYVVLAAVTLLWQLVFGFKPILF